MKNTRVSASMMWQLPDGRSLHRSSASNFRSATLDSDDDEGGGPTGMMIVLWCFQVMMRVLFLVQRAHHIVSLFSLPRSCWPKFWMGITLLTNSNKYALSIKCCNRKKGNQHMQTRCVF